MNKDSLVFYISQYEAVKELNDQQLGALYRAIFETALGNEPDITPDIKIAYNFIQNQVKIDAVKYEEISKKRSEAGRKGGYAKASKANASFAKQICLNDNVNDNDNDNVNVNENEGEDAQDTHTRLTFGQLGNVLLTSEQREELRNTYQDSNKLIDKVSAWLPNAKTEQNDHYALCIRFAQNDNWTKKPKPKPELLTEGPKEEPLTAEERANNVARLKRTLNGIL